MQKLLLVCSLVCLSGISNCAGGDPKKLAIAISRMYVYTDKEFSSNDLVAQVTAYVRNENPFVLDAILGHFRKMMEYVEDPATSMRFKEVYNIIYDMIPHVYNGHVFKGPPAC